ncbi:probable E3 ubiquitin-protein ligase ATL45 [Brachypodium distachyon]|uniref:RING-type domain-containing protein n=1 Tax=Brachypodium distachyon TaxID=15368 RepID=I1HA66_BRADI|nr:probable E3 ubiquitin-protein ligase ATL45 [Brachypodium distachyon]XP_024310842.1 probable E3 ubiquitin-protein ligase ATL45 [Brachypodium distachyon]KQK23852.1 hypothetical protein BRADI_1g76530v3 [Brachypodium distachyon]PNT78272.1 hypothetical protein BRADI_1g76530v3 [Brachypodium distachyon]|eukprot:XP_024310841.1 probable E3 ubiquitin-protein ligase ATL45 [Brachypodium distachyon]
MASSARRLLQTNSGQFPTAGADPPDSTLAADSDVVFVLAALLCALVCFLGLAAVARCTCARRAHNNALSSSSSRADAAVKGLEKEALRALPKLAYEDAVAAAVAARGRGPGLTAAGEEVKILAECAICLSEFAAREEIRVLPQCGHGFHAACVDAWLRKQPSCPSCRRVLVVVDDDTPADIDRCGRCDAASSSTSSTANY